MCFCILRKNVFLIIFNQYILSGVVTLLVFFMTPKYFPRYKLELIATKYTDQWATYFIDLDGDGLSEEFWGDRANDKENNATFIIYSYKGDLIDQWSFLTEVISFAGAHWFFDLDENGFKEVYFISHKNDSAFLNRIEPLSKNGINHEAQQIFIDKTIRYDGEINFGIEGMLISRHKFKGLRELYFILSAGYAGYPRNVYKYNLTDNQVAKSEHLTNVSKLSGLVDIDGNGFDEILTNGSSFGNQLDTSYTKRTDYSIWLNVLDHDLKFVFEPLEFKVPFSELSTLPFKNKEQLGILATLNSRHKESSPSKLLIYTNDGQPLKEKELGEGHHKVFVNSDADGFLLFNTTTGQLEKLNFDLEHLSRRLLAPYSELYEIDINEDGRREWLNVSVNKSSFKIYQENFERPVSFDLPNPGSDRFYYGVKQTSSGNLLFLQSGDYYYLFEYGLNRHYYLTYLIWPGVYLVILVVVFLIIKGQKIRAEKQRAIEKKISELQIKTIRNQVDPHFVFNAMNTIGEMVLTESKTEADDFICKFSDLMRATLEKSDKISCTLKEEIEYTENYIQLQQLRFNHSFQYKIDIKPHVDLNEIVPKHVLYSYVENAIKHGLVTQAKGLLTISVSSSAKELQLKIEDNGGGLGSSNATRKNSTGSGIGIMDQIYELFRKLNKKSISHSIENVLDTGNNPVGTRVTVRIAQ